MKFIIHHNDLSFHFISVNYVYIRREIYTYNHYRFDAAGTFEGGRSVM
ncbi:hypothetical protein [Methanimicrococcus hongohii]|nr:hypothetical protein [Methanimicrococcus sp. Hf6]